MAVLIIGQFACSNLLPPFNPNIVCVIQPPRALLTSIHSSVVSLLSGAESWRQQFHQGDPRLPFPWPHQPALTRGIPRRSQAGAGIKSLHLDLGLPRGLLPAGHARNTSLGRRPGGILTRCPNHLNGLLSTQRSSGSTPSSLRTGSNWKSGKCQMGWST